MNIGGCCFSILFGTLAQWIESQTSNLSVGGSSPSCLTTWKPLKIQRFLLFCDDVFFDISGDNVPDRQEYIKELIRKDTDEIREENIYEKNRN